MLNTVINSKVEHGTPQSFVLILPSFVLDAEGKDSFNIIRDRPFDIREDY